MNIIIPSFKRSHHLPGLDYFKTAKFVVPESQRDEYLKTVPISRLIVIPDDQDGNIGRKRNWVLRNIPRPLVMIDDDVRAITYTEGGQYFEDFGRAKQKIPMNPDRILDWMANGFNLAAGFGVKMWGLNINTDGRNYRQFLPFSLTKITLGPFQGHLNHDLEFDESVGSKDDYDMFLQQINTFGKVLKLNKYSYDCDHGTNSGGIVSFRTMEREIDWAKQIMRKWGKKTIQYKLPPKSMTDVLNAKKINIPSKGV